MQLPLRNPRAKKGNYRDSRNFSCSDNRKQASLRFNAFLFFLKRTVVNGEKKSCFMNEKFFLNPKSPRVRHVPVPPQFSPSKPSSPSSIPLLFSPSRSVIFHPHHSKKRTVNILDRALNSEASTSRQIQVSSLFIYVNNSSYPEIVSPTYSHLLLLSISYHYPTDYSHLPFLLFTTLHLFFSLIKFYPTHHYPHIPIIYF